VKLYLFGRTVEKAQLSVEDLRAAMRRARESAPLAAAAPSGYAPAVLERTGRLFRRGAPLRRRALAILREDLPFSAPVVEDTLDLLPGLLDAGELRRRMELELFLPEALEGFVPRPGYAGALRAAPRGVVLHVGAGNIFLGLIDSLVLGLLTRNANVLKVSSAGSRFPLLFAEALRRCDPKGHLSRTLAVFSWKGGSEALERAALAGCDAAMIWGGDEAVAGYRRLAPPKVHLAGFGARVSLAVALPGVPLEGLAAKAAFDASRWDQSACSSPHAVYLLGARFEDARRFAREMGEAFRTIQKGYPQSRLSEDEKVEITRVRQLAKVDAALGNAALFDSFPAPHWTVVAEKDPAFKASPMNRVVSVKTLPSAARLREVLAPWKGQLQSVGVAGPAAGREALLALLVPLGVTRAAPMGRMLASETGSPHDGTFPMRELVVWAASEGTPSKEERAAELARFAREHSPFYRKRGRARPPLLSKEDLLAHSPPGRRDMFTGPFRGGVFFASGGSTGKPKYVFYDAAEYDEVCRDLGLAMAAGGLGQGDVAANLFVPGNLWSSFLSIEKALPHTGAVSVPIGSALEVSQVVGYLHEFRATALIGLPSFLVKAAEEALRRKLCIPVRLIFYGGERMAPSMERFLKKVFPGARVRSAAYATADAGVVGFQCPRCAPGVHHVCEDQLLEVVAGELVTTPLKKRLMPLLRFRLGDLGRWLEKPCPCGRPEPLFELLGRCDDRVHAGGAHLFVSDVQEAVDRVPGLSPGFQIVVSKKGRLDRLTFRLEASKRSEALRTRFLAELRKRCADLAVSLDKGWLPEPEVELLAPEGIQRIARTGKLKRVVDER